MKIVLCTPPEDFSGKEQTPPLGLAYLAAVLESNNYDVEIIDSRCERLNFKQFVNKIKKANGDLFGITCYTHARFNVFSTAKLIKMVLPQVSVVVGGPHVFSTDVDTLSSVSEIDIIVRGEGERSFLELVQCVERGESLKKVSGITFRQNNKIIATPSADWIANLDDLPMPAWHLLPLEKYNSKVTDESVFGKDFIDIDCLGVMSSRGCPYRCIYCNNPILWGGFVRFRSPKRVVDELEFLISEYGYEGIDFWDDTINVSPKWTLKLCDEIIRRKLKIVWYCRARVNNLNRTLLMEMVKAGCVSIGLGVESGSPNILKNIRKGITLAQVHRAVKLCAKFKLLTKIFFMYNLPGETLKDFRSTLALMDKLETYGESIKCLGGITRIYPGTELESIAKRRGILQKNFSWSKPYYNRMNRLLSIDPTIPIFEWMNTRDLLKMTFIHNLQKKGCKHIVNVLSTNTRRVLEF
ncbi:radical SAM protein [Candidatus Borrarchaeum sp.]|uniref:B12-binding domain-containing radical SAM protein n=1 Tax=Candidatus Borrarchaeum sp. TaxID=2846742 RepID=UPI00257C6C8C|nr:radical SAM protein [Candidatus Borrarchaeum sp.]